LRNMGLSASRVANLRPFWLEYLTFCYDSHGISF
jgi:hypothetical protein